MYLQYKIHAIKINQSSHNINEVRQGGNGRKILKISESKLTKVNYLKVILSLIMVSANYFIQQWH